MTGVLRVFGVSMIVLVAAGSVAAAAPNASAPDPASATTAAAAEQVFAESGEFTVPAGVCEVAVDAVGAAGEGTNPQSFIEDTTVEATHAVGSTGGYAMSARAALAVTPGEVLAVNVDVGGGAAGSASAFRGGGASDVRRSPHGLADRLVVAGGGGGTGGGARGGDAGVGAVDVFAQPGDTGARVTVGDSSSFGGLGGGGASATSGGGLFGNGPQGGFGFGGAGAPPVGPLFHPGQAGGGGGGGWYGGSGGGPGGSQYSSDPIFPTFYAGGGGGGGGSSHGPPGTAFSQTGRPAAVTISFEPAGSCPDESGPDVSVATPADGAVHDRGSTVLAAFGCADEAGGSGVDTCVGTVADGEPIDTSTAGEFDFTVTGTDVAGNETVVTNTYTVRDGSLSIDLSADETTVAPGGTIHYTVTVTNTGEAPPPTTTTAPTTTSTTAALNASLVGDPIDLTGVTVTSTAVADCDRDIGDLAAGADVTYGCTHVAAVSDAPTFTNTATVDSDQSDPVDSTPVDVAVAIPAGSGLVSGTVTETGSGDPVPGAFVALLRTADFSLAAGAEAAADGSYTATVAVGDYYVYVLDGAHTAGFYGPPTLVTVTDGATTTADPTVPALAGTVTGTVTDAGGPLAGIWVVAINPAGAVVANVTTGPDGTYTLAGLDAGPYRIRFVDPTGAHPPLYYDNTAGYDDATPVTVTGGTATTGIDATLTTSG